MIDTHAHLDFAQYDIDRDDVIRSSFESGLEAMVNIGVDLETSQRSIELTEKYENIYAAVGIHPHDSGKCPNDYLARLKEMASHKKVVAIGETGLDYYRDLSPRNVQRTVFTRQLELALELGLPVVVHIRDAAEDSLKILEESGIRKGVLHSFPGDIGEARTGVEMGFFISFAGPITYPNSDRPEVAVSLPFQRIVTETDSPYLPPQAFRGKRNRPDYVRYVIDKLAELFSPYTYDDAKRITSHSARMLYDLPLNREPRIVYKIRRSLYLNLTNRCSSNCYFCPRNDSSQGHVAGHYLFLETEPSVEQILKGVESESGFDEVVFCGLGEPTVRMEEIMEIAAALKRRGHKIRLNTNGHGSLINRTDLATKLVGLVDKVSISLNSPDADTYVRICKPDAGEKAFGAVIDFIKKCRDTGIPTDVSFVELPEVDKDACLKMASILGVGFRMRKFMRMAIDSTVP